MNKAKVGIIGCGAIATKWHIPCFQKQEKAVVAAVCDISPQLAESTAKVIANPSCRERNIGYEMSCKCQ